MERAEAREVVRNLQSILTQQIPMERKEEMYRELYKGTEWETYVKEMPSGAVQAFINITEDAFEMAVEALGETETEPDQAGEK